MDVGQARIDRAQIRTGGNKMSDTGKTLAKVFQDLFGTRERAEELLDLFASAAGSLGVDDPDDPMIDWKWATVVCVGPQQDTPLCKAA